MEGSLLREAVKKLIRETLDDNQVINQLTPNEQGTIAAVNDDGTVNVLTESGLYQSVGTPTTRSLNEQVIVVTADGGVRVAI